MDTKPVRLWTPEREREEGEARRKAQAEQCAKGAHSFIVQCKTTGKPMCSACFEHFLDAGYICLDMHKRCPEHEPSTGAKS